MKRIGILLDAMVVDPLLADTVRRLQASDQIELYLLLSPRPEPASRQGLWQTINVGVFRLIALLERRLLAALSLAVEPEKMLQLEAAGSEVVVLQPETASADSALQYPADDMRTLRALELDLIVGGNAAGALSGDILTVAKDGVIAFRRSEPPAFWAVYARRPATAFAIEQLRSQQTGAQDNASVLYAGAFPTQRSYTENRQFFLSERNPCMADLVLRYAATGRLPAPGARADAAAAPAQIPNLLQSVIYILRTLGVLGAFILQKKILGRRERWGVAFTRQSWGEAALTAGTRITNPPQHYFADPFVIKRDGRTICFLEDYAYGEERGCIAAVELFADGRYELLGPVIQEAFHMSFPYVFEYGNELYMIPETSQARSIRLYKCRQFPLQWEYQHDLMTAIDAVDTLVFEHDSRWWLLTSIGSSANGDYGSRLFAFYGSSPLAQDWTPHQGNPVLLNSRIARNGGILRAADGGIVRGRQKQGFNMYGSALSLARLTELTPEVYAEETVREIAPDFFPGLLGCHHLHSNGEFTVYDFLRMETRG